MAAFFVLLLFFVGIGLFAPEYNAKTRLLLAAIIVATLLVMYIT